MDSTKHPSDCGPIQAFRCERDASTHQAPLPNRLLRVSAAGAIEESIELPEASARHANRFGFEGVTVTGSGDSESVWIAVQREWADDPAGRTKILLYRVATREWGVLHLSAVALTARLDGLLRDHGGRRGGVHRHRAQQPLRRGIKRLRFSAADLTPAAPGAENVPVLEPRLVLDVVPALAATGGTVIEKLEGFTIDAAGNAFAVTDNDGVDGSSGETQS